MAKKLDTTPFYRRIIGDALNIAWNHKQLWIFGFFATLIDLGGVNEVFFSSFERTATVLPQLAAGSAASVIPGFAAVRAVIQFSAYPGLTTLLLVLFGGVFGALFAWMTLVSAGGLIADIRKISRGGEPTFGDGLKDGSDAFWKLFGVNLCAKALILAAMLVTGGNMSALLRDGSLTSGMFYLLSFLAFVAFSFIAALVEVFGSIAVVVRRAGVREAAENALRMTRKHWLICLEMAAALLLVSMLVGAGSALLALVLSIPLILLVAVSSALQAAGAVIGAITLSAALLIVAVVLLGSFLTTVHVAAWTLLFEELSARDASGILHRLVHRLMRRR